MINTKLASIAGFFEGDGCVGSHINKRSQALVTVSIVQKYPEVLEEIKEHFEYGKVRKKTYKRRGKIHPSWQYQIQGAEQKLDFLQAVYSYLIIKQEQTRLAIELTKRIIRMNHPGRVYLSDSEREARIILSKRITELKNEPLVNISPVKKFSKAETLAYIAGFFSAEGCIHGIKQLRKNRTLRLGIGISIGQKDPYILKWIESVYSAIGAWVLESFNCLKERIFENS